MKTGAIASTALVAGATLAEEARAWGSIPQGDWTAWTSSNTVTLELTRAEWEAVVAALEGAHEALVEQATKLNGRDLQSACATSAAILAILFRAARYLD